MLLYAERFGQDVGQLLRGRDPLQPHPAARHLVSHEVILDVDVLGALTLDAAPGQFLRRLIVAVEYRRWVVCMRSCGSLPASRAAT